MLRTARSYWRGDKNCTAAWYLASVLRKRQEARESAGMFEAAMVCCIVLGRSALTLPA